VFDGILSSFEFHAFYRPFSPPLQLWWLKPTVTNTQEGAVARQARNHSSRLQLNSLGRRPRRHLGNP
jgi:hypothetical protein